MFHNNITVKSLVLKFANYFSSLKYQPIEIL